MSREIKFRVWDIERKQFCPDYFGNSQISLNQMFTENDGYCVFQQFTGLKDKNGKEIYEGDNLKDLDGEIGVIEFQNGSFIFSIENGKVIIPFWSMLYGNGRVQPHTIDSASFQIVGNIFENPELLK